MLLMGAKVGEEGKLFLVASIAHIHFGAMASLVVILHTYHGFQWLEFCVLFVPSASFLGTGVFPSRIARVVLAPHRYTAAILHGVTQSSFGFILLSMCPHVHPQIRVALEPFSTYMAVVSESGQQIGRIQLDNIMIC